ncbi:hypothetical protein ACFFUB_00500 [Algimonas porphyrae]|uniref:Uncharacterized protein n=1 Tax=Algimonas porphyrae TaxID=1128113 RepID=A0ABQ5V1J9_9PROT|nr:hypothetical protein [Algimonas porphyrae]GLQ20510.1 hypothetical protein GCM10007854_14650 [Algimonas porphyrae]
MSDILDTISTELGRLALEQAGWIDSANGLLDLTVAATARADAAVQADKGRVFLYVDPTSGQDANAGTLAAPFATLERALQEVRSLQHTEIGIMNNMTLSVSTTLRTFCGYLFLRGVDAAGVPAQRTLTVQDDAAASRPGGIFFENPFAALLLLDLDIAMGSQFDFGAFRQEGGSLKAHLVNTTLSETGANAASVFGTPSAPGTLDFEVANMSRTGLDGRIIQGVTDGTAFTNFWWLRSPIANF